MSLFFVLGIVSEAEAAKGKVSGLERTIPKAKGIEFFNLTHQLAVEFASTPFKPANSREALKNQPECKRAFSKNEVERRPWLPNPLRRLPPRLKSLRRKKSPRPKPRPPRRLQPKKVKATTKKSGEEKSQLKKVVAKTKKVVKKKAAAKKSPSKRLKKKKPR